MIVKAYAKINLSLALTGVREDGYHTLHTVMQAVSLCDELTVEKANVIRFSCSEPSLAGEKNLCVKAAKAFFRQAGIDGGARIQLNKKIPTGAGLGGGSADAAAVLCALNGLYGKPLDEADLYALSARLGADVPFCLYVCLHGGGKCLCEGIGEVLTPLPAGDRFQLVIAKGESGLSTPEMYRRMDAVRDVWSSSGREGMFNDFEPVAESVLADISVLKKRLTALGASFAMMSGSGSAVFGMFEAEEQAKKAMAVLRGAGFFAESCTTV